MSMSLKCEPASEPPLANHHQQTAAEWGGNNLEGFGNFRAENGSSQGQRLALTGLFVPSSLDSVLPDYHSLPPSPPPPPSHDFTFEFVFLNTKPSTLNHEPESLIIKPYSLILKPYNSTRKASHPK